MVINLQLGCLCIFANLGAIDWKWLYRRGGCDLSWVARFTSWLLDFSKDGVIKGSLLYGYVFLFHDVAYDDPCNIVIVVEVNRGPVFPELKEHVHGRCVSTKCCRVQVALIVIIHSAHEVFDIYCSNALVTYIWSAGVWDSHDSLSFDVMRLRSSFSFKVFISLWDGHNLVNTIPHINKISSGWIWKKEQWVSSG